MHNTSVTSYWNHWRRRLWL